jgi:LPPG:FO 2-phospho-L-lactate transferase
MTTLLTGGGGGAKLAHGMAQVVEHASLTTIVNTGDDFEWQSLYVAPDIDTILYTLAGVIETTEGWGIAGDTTHVLQALARYGFTPWFRVGDRDIATHLARTTWMRQGARYTEAVARLAQAMGVGVSVLPMCDEPVRTILHTAIGALEFQHYYVRHKASIPVTGIGFSGIELARPTPEVLDALRRSSAIVLGPSNPFVSIGPILALPGLREMLKATCSAVIAVSPIVGGRALKGPAGRMLSELGFGPSALSVARLYADFLDGFVLDVVDGHLQPEIESLGMAVLTTDTVMQSTDDRRRLAHEILSFVGTRLC